MNLDCAVVIPTIGRPNVQGILDALALPPTPREVIIVNDRPKPLRLVLPGELRTRIVAGPGRGPAAARNLGWRLAAAPWVAFLDDDVQIGTQWTTELGADLARAASAGAAGVQGRLAVPLPDGRRPTDWERQVAGLAGARWITADMVYRREVLAAVGGFDERFHRAFREDAELALRIRERGDVLIIGGRRAEHGVADADRWVSVRRQVGNADDALMRRLHGPQWRDMVEVQRGRRRGHALVTVAALTSALAVAAGWPGAAAVLALGWLAGTVEFAVTRIWPGPRTAAEVATMALTSVVIPPLAVGHYLHGWLRHHGARPLVGSLAPAPSVTAGNDPTTAGNVPTTAGNVPTGIGGLVPAEIERASAHTVEVRA
jgi:GT2 family glycosyltransferase